MHIALVSPLFESVPPKLYGGTERVVANLCRGLTELGHEVTLFASGDSQVATDLVATVPEALRLAATKVSDPTVFHLSQTAVVAKMASEFDVIHNHMDYAGLPLSLLRDTPVVTTLHGRIDHPETLHCLHHYQDSPLVSISHAQRRPAPTLNWVATVYHGLPLDTFHFKDKPGSYLAFLGRMSEEKGPRVAIDIARAAGVPLKMAAKVDSQDRDFFEAQVKPHIDGRFIEYVGEIGEHEKSDFLGNALGMLFPIEWPEPFGIAPIEAWAVGTPVLARPFGSVSELHCDGVTGFVRNSWKDLVASVPELARLDRAAIRAYAERHFSLRRMCEDYVHVYRDLIHQRPLQFNQPYDRQRGLLYPVGRITPRHQ